ncbi:MAG: LysR substrate-binding domain-containing protein [Pseudomonadota bacterium]
MTLTELRYIIAVARELHFGRAAKACFVSQPTLSVAVRKLEDELGVPIFERGKGEISVTEPGLKIVEQAQRVLEETDKIRQLSEQGSDQLSGPLRIGAIHTIGPYLFPGLIPDLAAQAQGLQLAIEENYTATLTEKLRHGELDVIIISLPFVEPGIETSELYDEQFVVLLPSSHPLTAEESIVTSQLEQEPVLLLGKGHCFRDQVLEFCTECGHSGILGDSIQKSIEGGSLETIRYMVASGLGITVLPCTAAGADKFSQRLLQIRRFKGEQPQRRIALAWRSSFTRPQAIELLKNVITSNLMGCVKAIS